MPLPEKVLAVVQMQRMAAPVVRARGRQVVPLNLMPLAIEVLAGISARIGI